jgi:hypothetical protein
MNKVLALATFLFLFSATVFSQFAYRLNADILTKTRLVDSTFQISKGKIFYDLNNKKIIYDLTFPRNEKVVLFDTLLYTFIDNGLESVAANYLIPEQSVFHFMLTGSMNNYGLKESNFTATSSEKNKDLLVTTWSPPEQLRPVLSKIEIATRNKQIYSITMFDGDEKIMNRQILKDYRLINGVYLPTEILLATYLSQGTVYQVITLSNVVINETGNHQKYDHAL